MLNRKGGVAEEFDRSTKHPARRAGGMSVAISKVETAPSHDGVQGVRDDKNSVSEVQPRLSPWTRITQRSHAS